MSSLCLLSLINPLKGQCHRKILCEIGPKMCLPVAKLKADGGPIYAIYTIPLFLTRRHIFVKYRLRKRVFELRQGATEVLGAVFRCKKQFMSCWRIFTPPPLVYHCGPSDSRSIRKSSKTHRCIREALQGAPDVRFYTPGS